MADENLSPEILAASLRSSAKTALDVFERCALSGEAKMVGEAKGLMDSAIEAIKMAEVLTGNVSDRTARQGDALATELKSAQKLLNTTRKYDASAVASDGGNGAPVAANRPRQAGNA